MTAVAKQIFECRVASERLVPAKRLQQISKGLLGNVKLANRLRQGDEYGMPRAAGVAGIEFRFPLIQYPQGCVCITDLVA